MANFEFKLPDIGEGVTEGEIVNWLVKEGDVIREDQEMVEVMTDKATVTIGAPKAGRVLKLGGNVGDVGWPDCGEIDIVENKGQEAYTVHGTVHGPGYSGGQGVTSYKNLLGMPLADDFHVYAIEWSPNKLVFSVDEFEYFTFTPAQLPKNTRWVFDHPFAILLDLAVGGNYVGPPDSTTPFPQTMVVDYVRVYEPAP